jgi:hypothetical protein
VGCYLLSLVPDSPARGLHRPPVQAAARYLVTTWAPQVADAHRLLGDIFYAASQRADMEVEHEELPALLWHSLGVRPQPALVLRSTVRWSQVATPAPPVRGPIQIQLTPMAIVAGTIVSPSGIPIAAAEVRMGATETPVWTDPDGRFELHTAGTDAPHTIIITARGVTRTVPVSPIAGAPAPVTVVFDPTEE